MGPDTVIWCSTSLTNPTIIRAWSYRGEATLGCHSMRLKCIDVVPIKHITHMLSEYLTAFPNLTCILLALYDLYCAAQPKRHPPPNSIQNQAFTLIFFLI